MKKVAAELKLKPVKASSTGVLYGTVEGQRISGSIEKYVDQDADHEVHM